MGYPRVNPKAVHCTVNGTGGAMNARKLDLSDLGQLVYAERTRRGLSLREAAVETDIPLNTPRPRREGTRSRPPEVQTALGMDRRGYPAILRGPREGDCNHCGDC